MARTDSPNLGAIGILNTTQLIQQNSRLNQLLQEEAFSSPDKILECTNHTLRSLGGEFGAFYVALANLLRTSSSDDDSGIAQSRIPRRQKQVVNPLMVKGEGPLLTSRPPPTFFISIIISPGFGDGRNLL
jgi:hypothetical protein